MNGLGGAIPHRSSRTASPPPLLIKSLPCLLASLLAFFAVDVLSAQQPKVPAPPSPASSTRAAEPTTPPEFVRVGRYEEAIEATTRLISDSDFNDTNRLLKMQAEMELGRYADALATLDAALQKFPGSIALRWFGRDVVRFNNQADRVKAFEEEIGSLVRQTPWRYSDTANQVILGRYLLAVGLDPKQVLDRAFNAIKKQQPGYVPAWIASGDLALSKGDFALAAQHYQQAAKLDPTDAQALFGLAQAFAPSEAEKMDQALKAALEINPHHVGALLMAVDGQIDSEQYVKADELLQTISGINPHQPLAAAYRAVLAHLRNQPDKEQLHREVALKFWPTNPEVDYLIGKKLSQKYRFAEGSAAQRRALKFDPQYQPARMQLATDLLRLGQEEEGWKLADELHQADGYNVVAHNLVLLQDSVSKFRTLEEDGIIARMDAREAEIYGRRVLDLLLRAKRELCAKYDVRLPSPIIVEMFPKQEDFAIRTFGLPGGAGFLGVCFGTVITANSPASQMASPTCWESTLWHEFCHVVTLNKTHNRMPRWLSEGISVYEERQAHPTWGQRMSPHSRKMLLGDELTPVDQLSSAFLHPASAQHLQFAYFESSLVVEYLVQQHGIDTLKKILVDLGQGLTINDGLARHTGSLEELNKGFTEYARQQAEAMAPGVDWSEPELPRRADAVEIAKWVHDHPNNYPALQRVAKLLIVAKKWEAAKEPLLAMLKLYPGDPGDDGAYPMLARVYRELKDLPAERDILEKFSALTDDNVDLFSRMADLTSQAGEWERAREFAERWLAVNPLQPAPHRIAALAADRLHDDRTAIGSYQALLLLNPVDVADLHLKLSQALQRSGDIAGAKRHALLAVEEAPRFRAGHKHLLDILRASGDTRQPAAGSADRPAAPDLPESAETKRKAVAF